MGNPKTLKVIDLFAGVGGFRVGLEVNANKKLGKKAFEFVWGNQWEPSTKVQHAAEIYRKWFSTSDDEFSNEDINKVKTKDIPAHDLLVAGFPCQDYSVASKKYSGGIEGRKGVLWWQSERIIREKGKNAPDYILLENVDRLLNSPASQRGRDFAIMLTCLNQLGYAVEWRVIDASEYGFPQRRKRIFFLGYKKGTELYEKAEDKRAWLFRKGVIARTFPIIDEGINEVSRLVIEIPKKSNSKEGYFNNIKDVSTSFNKERKKTPFKNTGVMKKGLIYTIMTKPNYQGKHTYLRDILLDEVDVPEEYFIPKNEYKKWEYLKGAKKEKRRSSGGYEYKYTEGAITYPDVLDRASRTVITGEGGSAPSRFKHVVRTKSGKLRRLTPIELEKLNMFPENFTEGCSDSRRAFLMGNALVVGVVQKLGTHLYKSI